MATAASLPDGFEDIDTIIAAREADPDGRAALARARQRLSQPLQGRVSALTMLRLQRGWSRDQLAAALGIDRDVCAELETGGDVSRPSLPAMAQWARTLRVTVDEIDGMLRTEDGPAN
ncbi:MAG: helix-turn-helix domain-containing protein [Dehalococcoidia bacterium]